MTEQETVNVAPVQSENKRKLDDLVESQRPQPEDITVNENVESVDGVNGCGDVDSDVKDAKRIRLDEEPADENGHDIKKVSAEEDKDVEHPVEEVEHVETQIKLVEGSLGSEEKLTEGGQETEKVDAVQELTHEEETKKSTVAGQVPSKENLETDGTAVTVEDQLQPSPAETVEEDGFDGKEKTDSDTPSTSRTMEIPNNKVGVLIGKAGDTIRFLQINSGAKIQITRDAEADPRAPTRPVELIGSLESIEKAEKLIKDVISEADAGGVPSLVARGITKAQTAAAAEQVQMHVPNDKVGMIIGKGGETIKYLQATSGARIQLIPQHLPEGDQSTERIVRVSGDKKQIEIAREMIMEVMTQPIKQSPRFGGYNQQTDRFRGAWGPRDGPYHQHSRYDYHHHRAYPLNPMHRPPPYDHYPGSNFGPRGGYGPGWQQQPPMHRPPYDDYGRSSHFSEGPAGSRGPMPNHNYGYPPQYPHTVPPPTGYGHGYDEMKFGGHAPVEHPYGGQGSNPPAYGQTYPSYAPNQHYGKPASYPTPNAAQSAAPQAYGAPWPVQPEAPYQAGNLATVQPYGQNMPPQQPAPYSSGVPAQPSYPTYPAGDGYVQQQQATTVPAYVHQTSSGYAHPVAQQVSGPGAYVQQPSGYAQPAAQHASGGYVQQAASGYAQPVAQQPASGYAQPAAQQTSSAYGSQAMQPASYASYPTSQPGYADQSAATNTVYTYQAATTVPDSNAAYSAQQSSQQGYAQPQPAQTATYDQSVTQ